MKHIRLTLPDEVYNKVDEAAQKKGQEPNDYIEARLKDDLDIDQSFVQKSGIYKCIPGDSIVQNGNLVHLNGIYYNYRVQGNKTAGRIEQIDERTIYKVVGFDGNVVVLRPTQD